MCTGKKEITYRDRYGNKWNLMKKNAQNEKMKYIKKMDDWQGGIISINIQQLNVFTL